MRRLIVMAIGLLASASCATHADELKVGAVSEGQRTISIDPQTGATIDSVVTTGKLSELKVGIEGRLFDPVIVRDAEILFSIQDLLGHPQGVNVVDVQLFLTVPYNSEYYQVGLYGFGDTDGVADFDTPVEYNLGSKNLSPNAEPTTFSWSGTALESFIQSLADEKTPYAGFQLYYVDGPSRNWIDFAGSDASVLSAFRPRLEITYYVPEPSSVFLALVGLACVLGVSAVGRLNTRHRSSASAAG